MRITWLPWWLRRLLWWETLPPPRPGPMAISNVEEKIMLQYTVNMPPKPDISDLDHREVTVVLDSNPDIRKLPPDTAMFKFHCEPGTQVNITLVDIDTSGNRSERSEPLAFTATDTVPPPVPGGMSIGSVEQIDPVPTPTHKRREE